MTKNFYEFAESTISHTYNRDSNVVTLNSSGSPFTNFQTYSIIGQNVINKSLSQTSEAIVLFSLQDGVYLLKVSAEGRNTSIKLLKQ